MTSKTKILQVIGSLETGGAEKVVMDFGRYLDKSRFQCDYLVFGDNVGDNENEAISLGSNVIRIPKPKDNYIKYFNNLKKVLKDGKYNVVHSHQFLNNGLVLKAAYDVNIKKRISHSHSTSSGRKEDIKYKLYSHCMRKIIRKYATHFISCGLDAGDFLYGEKLFKDKGIVINNGVDSKSYGYNIETRNKLRLQLGIDKKLVMGHVGRLAPVKNHDFLVDIFYEVNKLKPDSVLLIVGEGELRSTIENKIRSLGLKDKVIFTGLRSDVSDILQAMDVFVFPSLYEGLPLTLIEAQASGIQCLVSTNVTTQSKVTDLISFISLEKSKEEWAKKVVENSMYYRTDWSEEINKKGFDVYTTIKELESIYTTI